MTREENDQEQRDALEAEAIPLCRMWREQHPELQLVSRDEQGAVAIMVPAPYCCSAYCKRCQGLRMLDGETLIEPNEWIHP